MRVPSSRRLASIGAAVSLVALAVVVTATTPGPSVIEAPFGVPISADGSGQGRNLVVAVDSVQLARQVSTSGGFSGGWTGETPGIWLIVDARVSAVTDPTSMTVSLVVDGVRYADSDRAGSGVLSSNILEPGLTIGGAVLIELPGSVLSAPGAHQATLRFATTDDPRLDSLLEVRVDLTTLDTVDTVELPEVARA